ncbi:hypothetical protein ABMA28_013235 [Loxostege sticticalis]|uniref:E3 ubiquitin-protein ligase PPP1R11 n=1 Tax=Loxostege sticticalis TaxID=481309 RepID=A0ABD0THP0_LOXSC
MGERTLRPEDMATTSTAVATVAPPLQEERPPVAVITLRPARAQPRKKVVWTEDTVDNEHMNKKKSKCCCIYEKPRRFGESDSDDSDDECEHCFGHVEKRRAKQQEATTTTTDTQDGPAPEPAAALTLKPAPAPAPAPPDPPATAQ